MSPVDPIDVHRIAVRRIDMRLRPDPKRVLAKLFIPGQEDLLEGESRAGTVADRVLALSDDQAITALDEVVALFAGRHHDLAGILTEHFELVAHRVADPQALSATRRHLVGAYFTQEFAVEAAAVCNPSIVPHPDQSGLGPDELRIVMSLRAIGEGHRSSIEFRTGTVGPDATLRLDEPDPHVCSGRRGQARYHRHLFQRVLRSMGDAGSNARFVLNSLPDQFSAEQLDGALRALGHQLVTRADATRTIERFESIAASNYAVEFPPASSISGRVLSPMAPMESHGMEDARFVRLAGDPAAAPGSPASAIPGSPAYYATYTAYDGRHVSQQLLATSDFCTFSSTQLTGEGARNKGMALFPRQVGGRFVALSRWDRATNALVTSNDLVQWDDPISLPSGSEPWELVQQGNCGSPLETRAGWIALTHGVGPMRRYAIGAMLLDLDDPTRVIGRLAAPLLVPEKGERDGYVPNVVYSCGAMLHDGHLLLPYGSGDVNVSVAVIRVDQLLDRLTSGRRTA